MQEETDESSLTSEETLRHLGLYVRTLFRVRCPPRIIAPSTLILMQMLYLHQTQESFLAMALPESAHVCPAPWERRHTIVVQQVVHVDHARIHPSCQFVSVLDILSPYRTAKGIRTTVVEFYSFIVIIEWNYRCEWPEHFGRVQFAANRYIGDHGRFEEPSLESFHSLASIYDICTEFLRSFNSIQYVMHRPLIDDRSDGYRRIVVVISYLQPFHSLYEF